MDKLVDIYERRVNTQEIIDEVLSLITEDVTRLNKEQLFEGRSPEGRMRKYKNQKYADKKNRMNPKPGRGIADLKLKGDFYDGFYAELRSKYIEIYSRDKKTKWLDEGTKNMKPFAPIFGLDDKGMDELRGIALELFQRLWRVEVGLQ